MLNEVSYSDLETIRYVTPAAIVVVTVFFCFTAVAATVDDERFWVEFHFGWW